MSLLRSVVIRGHCNFLNYEINSLKKDLKINLKPKTLQPLTTNARNKQISKCYSDSSNSKTPKTLYMKIMNSIDPFVPQKIRPMWEHEAGPKTIFFWAPLMKATLVVASLKDLRRKADTISLRQSLSLACNGVLWSRWSLIVIPKNYLMFTVNLFVFLTQAIQTTRALLYLHSSGKRV